jgi:NADH dehydrogenase
METDFLIVGAGFAGLETAMQLRRKAKAASITLLTKEPRLVYKPWLVYLPAQHKQFDQCLIPLEPLAKEHRLRLLVDTITMLSPEEHQAQLAGGERIRYAQVVIATGSLARREAIPGGKTQALFPCDVEDAHRLRERLLALSQGTVTVIIAGPRPGPGLEYAGWMARYVQERQRTSSIHIQLIDAQPRLMAHLGERAASLLEQIMSKLGIRLFTGQHVEEIAEQEIRLQDGKLVASSLTAVVGSLRGVDLGLTAPVVDEQGFVPVNKCFQSPSHPDLFAVGDAAALPWGDEIPKTAGMARRQARFVAHNVLAQANGQPQQAFPWEHLRTNLFIAMPDVGGQTVMVKQGGRVLLSGSWPLVLRSAMDRSYFRKRTHR